jgi:cytochrome c-type biogenesis protein CcmE
MRKRSQRLWLIGAAVLLAGGATALASTALKNTVAYFYAPSDLVDRDVMKPGLSARVGGLVEHGSYRQVGDGGIEFKITDGDHAVPVSFNGLVPDLFQEGQGIVAEGKFDEHGQLVAKRVLAKHDETYMPKEVYDAMKDKAGADGMKEYEPQKATQKDPAT